MSQVIVTNDKLNLSRQKSAEQEAKINKDIMVDRRMSDLSKKDPIAAAIGIAALPILALWSFICGLIFLATSLFRFIMAGIGKLVGGKSIWNNNYTKKK